MPVALRGLALCALGLLLLGPVVGACSFSPAIAGGTIGCGDGGACPPGFSCAPNGECYASAAPACGSGPACAAGQRCSAGQCECDATSCPDGCCNGTTCEVRGPTTCGTGGESCIACPPLTADRCSASGTCRCGTGLPCIEGLHCWQGACVCDAVSCPNGCCASGACSAPSAATCGGGGAECTPCDKATADTCVAGLCQCGDRPPCAGCDGGVCPALGRDAGGGTDAGD